MEYINGDNEVEIVELDVNAKCVCGCGEQPTMLFGNIPVPVCNIRHYHNYRKTMDKIRRENIRERTHRQLNLGSKANE